MLKLFEKNKDLVFLNTWKVHSIADYFYQPTSRVELQKVYQWVCQNEIPVSVLGSGSNVLLSDRGVEGLVLNLDHLNRLEECVESRFLILNAEAGVQKSFLLKAFLKHKLDPALFLAGLPGQCAGGVVMNAGVGQNLKPREFCEIVESFEVLKPDGHIQKYDHKDIHWDYRKSLGWQPGIIVSVQLRWPYDPNENIMIQLKEINKRRNLTQPLSLPNCGSVFKNPDHHKAGVLIENCGLKGYKIGLAQVSSKHANFITTEPGVLGQDILSLIEFIQQKVYESTSLHLYPEVRRIGRF